MGAAATAAYFFAYRARCNGETLTRVRALFGCYLAKLHFDPQKISQS